MIKLRHETGVVREIRESDRAKLRSLLRAGFEPVEEHRRPVIRRAAQKLINEHELDPAAIAGTGKDGAILKADVEAHVAFLELETNG
jgi:pyruvate/2-oxoglutarate dehydrogenase complex dihydrolipoamide acyltransferase (E2) component